MPIRLPGALIGRLERPVVALDMSLSGCLVQCEAPLDSGAILDLRLELSPEATLTAKVRVSESSLDGSTVPDEKPRYLAGLAFLSLSAKEEAQLRRFLDEERRRRRSADAPAH